MLRCSRFGCCLDHGKALKNISDRLGETPEDVATDVTHTDPDLGYKEILGGAAAWVSWGALQGVLQVVAISIAGGCVYILVDILYLRARKEERSAVLLLFLIRSSLRAFFFIGLILATLNLGYNVLTSRPLNEKWVNINGLAITALGALRLGRDKEDKALARRLTIGIDTLKTIQLVGLLGGVVGAIGSGRATLILQNRVLTLKIVVSCLITWKWVSFIRKHHYPTDLKNDKP